MPLRCCKSTIARKAENVVSDNPYMIYGGTGAMLTSPTKRDP